MIQKLLEQSEKQLHQAGCETPRLDAEVILAHVLGCERFELYTTFMRYPAPHEKGELFQSYIARRVNREPVAYIIGYKEFWSLKIKVTPAVLIPRPETETLVEKALEVLRSFDKPVLSKVEGLRMTGHSSQKSGHGEPVEPYSILDLCTGSGCIAAALAKEKPNAKIIAADISKEALEVAQENLQFASDRTTLIQSNLLENISGTFDLIVSNPPYGKSSDWEGLAPEIKNYEPRPAIDGGFDGQGFVNRICQDAPQFLKPGGHLIIENGAQIEIWNGSSLKGESPLTALSL